jgi:hypothetical protein
VSTNSDHEGKIALAALIVLGSWLLIALPILYMPPDPTARWYGILRDFAAPIATIIAAIAASLLAYRLGKGQLAVAEAQAEIARQTWQSTHERIVLELLDRRLAIFNDIREVIGEVARTGRASESELYGFNKASDRVPYLFGSDVQEFLETIRIHLIELNLANTMMKNQADPQYADWVKRRTTHFKAIIDFYKLAPTHFQPYMTAHQKVA